MEIQPYLFNQETLILPSEHPVILSNLNLDFNFNYNDKFSVSFWIKTKSQKLSALIAKMTDKIPRMGWDVLINDVDVTGVLRFQLVNSFPKNWIEARIDATDVLNGCWHHVLISYDGNSKANGIKFFVDGFERSAYIISDRLSGNTENSSPIIIGERSDGDIEFYGNMSDVRIYGDVLSLLEVKDIFSSSKLYKKKTSFEENDSNAVIIKSMQKIYHLHHNPPRTIVEKISTIGQKRNIEDLLVLDKINIEIKYGEMVGIIGKNGSGKTTLLKIIAGIIKPTKGEIIVNGKIAPFLALGSGFNNELDASENIILYGMLLGVSKKEIVSKIPQILKFAELERYADVKLKNFSSGMFMRLAFSVAATLEPDVLIIDEVLAVGDESFQKKSFQKLLSFKEEGKTIILVTHNLQQVENLCDRAIFLQGGKIIAIGSPKEVIDTYRKSQ